MRRLVGLNLWDDELPDETTILNFPHLLERQGLSVGMFAAINAHLHERGVTLSRGTMVDAIIVHAPSSTSNRDPKIHQTRKWKQWYFGMKIHVGADVASGEAYSVTVTAANRADIDELPKLLCEEEP